MSAEEMLCGEGNVAGKIGACGPGSAHPLHDQSLAEETLAFCAWLRLRKTSQVRRMRHVLLLVYEHMLPGLATCMSPEMAANIEGYQRPIKLMADADGCVVAFLTRGASCVTCGDQCLAALGMPRNTQWPSGMPTQRRPSGETTWRRARGGATRHQRWRTLFLHHVRSHLEKPRLAPPRAPSEW
jgi:hypothetical protein